MDLTKMFTRNRCEWCRSPDAWPDAIKKSIDKMWIDFDKILPTGPILNTTKPTWGRLAAGLVRQFSDWLEARAAVHEVEARRSQLDTARACRQQTALAGMEWNPETPISPQRAQQVRTELHALNREYRRGMQSSA